METTAIRKELHDYLDKANDRFLKMVYALMQVEQEDNQEYELSEEHKAILEERLEEYHKNPKAGSPAEEVLSRIEKKL